MEPKLEPDSSASHFADLKLWFAGLAFVIAVTIVVNAASPPEGYYYGRYAFMTALIGVSFVVALMAKSSAWLKACCYILPFVGFAVGQEYYLSFYNLPSDLSPYSSFQLVFFTVAPPVLLGATTGWIARRLRK